MQKLFSSITAACQQHYGTNLVSLLVFGSAGRGLAHGDSDIDLLIVAHHLPGGRVRRVADFQIAERAVLSDLRRSGHAEKAPELSPVFKTPLEVTQGSPLFLDMIEDAFFLYDKDSFMRRTLDEFKKRLDRLGARRVWKGSAWYWDLKPDYEPGQEFEL